MDFLGIGPGELILIMIVAMIVLGPARLPEIGASIGRALSEFRKASSAITEELNREMHPEIPAQEPARTVDPVILDPAQAAPHIVEETPAETSPLPQGFRRLSVRDDDESPRKSAAAVPLLPEGEAEIAILEAELAVKRAASTLEIRRLETELDTRRLEAELAAKRQAALVATPVGLSSQNPPEKEDGAAHEPAGLSTDGLSGATTPREGEALPAPASPAGVEGAALPSPGPQSPDPVADSELPGPATSNKRPRPSRRKKSTEPVDEAESSGHEPEVGSAVMERP